MAVLPFCAEDSTSDYGSSNRILQNTAEMTECGSSNRMLQNMELQRSE